MLNAGSSPTAFLNSVSGRDVDLTTSFLQPTTGLVRGWDLHLGGGAADWYSDYRVKVRVTATGTTLYLARTVSGAETILTTQTVSGLVVAAGDVLNVRLQAEGNGTTTLRAKIWRSGTAEPAAWTTTGSDTTAALQAAGAVGLQNYLSGSATNAPVVASIADFQLVPL